MKRKLRLNSWEELNNWRYSKIHWVEQKLFKKKRKTATSDRFDRQTWTCKHGFHWSALWTATFQLPNKVQHVRGHWVALYPCFLLLCVCCLFVVCLSVSLFGCCLLFLCCLFDCMFVCWLVACLLRRLVVVVGVVAVAVVGVVPVSN